MRESDDMLNKRSSTLSLISLIYVLCFAFRGFEYFVLRTDQTFWNEAFIHKVLGILILYLSLKLFDWKAEYIGFTADGIFPAFFKGLGFGLSTFLIAYLVEILILAAQGKFETLQVYVSAYAIDGNIGNRVEWIAFVFCFFGNIINVIMEEGLFRGLFSKMLEREFSFLKSAIISACMFGVWHIAAPVRSYCDGAMRFNEFITSMMMLILSSGLVGFKFSLLAKMTGNLYMSMGDHFVNNTITNILHLISDTGADELQIIRIAIAQSLSFIIVLIFYLRRYRREAEDARLWTALHF